MSAMFQFSNLYKGFELNISDYNERPRFIFKTSKLKVNVLFQKSKFQLFLKDFKNHSYEKDAK